MLEGALGFREEKNVCYKEGTIKLRPNLGLRIKGTDLQKLFYIFYKKGIKYM